MSRKERIRPVFNKISQSIFFIVVFCSTAYGQAGQESTSFFPLNKGNYWVYQGTMTSNLSENEEAQKKDITWRMKVVDVFEREDLTVVLLNGFLSDLIIGSESTDPEDCLILIHKNKYYLVEGDRVYRVLSRIKDPKDKLRNLIIEDEIFLTADLKLLKSFGNVAQKKRGDDYYRWVVEDQSLINLDQLEGLRGQETHIRYQLIFRTLPDDTIIDFVPGVGITRYLYQHHGTINHTDVRLVEFFKG